MKNVIGLIIKEGSNVLNFASVGADVSINWSNCSKEFRDDFMETWKKADMYLESKCFDNVGADIMCVLEGIAEKINAGKITEDFQDAYEAVARDLFKMYNNG